MTNQSTRNAVGRLLGLCAFGFAAVSGMWALCALLDVQTTNNDELLAIGTRQSDLLIQLRTLNRRLAAVQSTQGDFLRLYVSNQDYRLTQELRTSRELGDLKEKLDQLQSKQDELAKAIKAAP